LALQNVKISSKYLKQMLFNQVLKTGSSRVIDTYDKVKEQLSQREKSFLIKEAIMRKNVTWLKHFIGDANKIVIYDGKYKSDILTFCLFVIGEAKNSLINPCFEVVLEYIKLNPLKPEDFDAKFFVRNLLYGCNSSLIAKNYNLFKQINIPGDLSTHVKNTIFNWIFNTWRKINYSNLNIILNLGWCKTNVFDCLTANNILEIENEVDSSNNYYRTNNNIKVFYQIAYIFHVNKIDMGANSQKIFELFEFDHSIYKTDLLESWSKETLIVPLELELVELKEKTDTVTVINQTKKGKTTKNKKDINV
jgi:hypothetical protein